MVHLPAPAGSAVVTGDNHDVSAAAAVHGGATAFVSLPQFTFKPQVLIRALYTLGY